MQTNTARGKEGLGTSQPGSRAFKKQNNLVSKIMVFGSGQFARAHILAVRLSKNGHGSLGLFLPL